MSELLTDDQARTAFARLRATELAGLRPPGVAGVHGALRRRRIRRTAAVGTGLATGLLLAAGVYAQLPGPAPLMDTDADGRGPDPTVAMMAARQLESVGGPTISERKIVTGFGVGDEPAIELGRTQRGLQYRVAFACVGSGILQATLTVGGQQSTWQHSCGVANRPTSSAELAPAHSSELIAFSLRSVPPQRRSVEWAVQLRWSRTVNWMKDG
ncbi:MAG TPA: hypothetical protein VF755_08540 [Catenuloplanes sp.]|jgi:hypothetical protein